MSETRVRLLDRLGEAGVLNLERVVVDSASVRAEGGGHAGPNPTNRGKGGCKRHALTDAEGLPLVVRTGPANARGEAVLEHLLDAFPVLTDGDRYATAHVLPRALLGDRGYGFPYLIGIVERYGIECKLSARGKQHPHGSGLGKERYVVERGMAWWNHFGRINRCYERKPEHVQGMHELAACILCANKLRAANKPSRL